MTKPSFDQRDKPFSDWLRKNPKLHSVIYKLDVTDIDFIFQKYQTNIDNIGSREVRLMFNLEVKTYGKKPNDNQQETLFFNHQRVCKKGNLFSTKRKAVVSVWHFGCYYLIMHEGARPDNCIKIEWGIYNTNGDIIYHIIDEQILINILSFEIRPDTFQKLKLRRHHKTRKIFQINEASLGFPMVELVRS